MAYRLPSEEDIGTTGLRHSVEIHSQTELATLQFGLNEQWKSPASLRVEKREGYSTGRRRRFFFFFGENAEEKASVLCK